MDTKTAQWHLDQVTRAFHKQNFAEGIWHYSEAIKLDPTNPSNYHGRATALLYFEKKPAEAIPDLSQAALLEPYEPKYLMLRGDCRYVLGDITQAILDYYQSMEINTDHIYNIFDSHHNDIPNRKRREDILDEVISNQADFMEAYVIRGLSRARWSNKDEAFTDLNRALELAPDNADLYIFRANLYGKIQQWEKAFADAEVAIRLAPSSPLAYATRGLLFFNSNNRQKAKADIDEALRLDPRIAEERRVAKLIKIFENDVVKPADDRSPQQKAEDEKLPEPIQTLAVKVLWRIQSHPTHQFMPGERRNFYDALSSQNSLFARHVMGWLGLLSAKHALPIFENALPDESLPREMLELAETLLKGTTNRYEAREKLAEAHTIAGNTWGQDEETMPANVLFAGLSSHRAAIEAYEPKTASQLENIRVYRQDRETKLAKIEKDEVTDLTLAFAGQGDASSLAAMAVACTENNTFNPEKLLAFWEWWFKEALSEAWRSASEFL